MTLFIRHYSKPERFDFAHQYPFFGKPHGFPHPRHTTHTRTRNQQALAARRWIGTKHLSKIASFMSAPNVSQDENTMYITLDVPGIKATDLSVKMDDQRLTISGHRTLVLHSTSIKRDSRAHDQNHSTKPVSIPQSRPSRFHHQLTINSRALDVANLSASLGHGVLTISVPKISDQRKGPRLIAISEIDTSTDIPNEKEASSGSNVETHVEGKHEEGVLGNTGGTMPMYDGDQLQDDKILVEAINEKDSLENHHDDSETNQS